MKAKEVYKLVQRTPKAFPKLQGKPNEMELAELEWPVCTALESQEESTATWDTMVDLVEKQLTAYHELAPGEAAQSAGRGVTPVWKLRRLTRPQGG